MFKAYKYRLYPNESQKTAIAQHLGCSRWVYNYALNKKVKAYEIEGKTLSRFDLQKDLPVLKKEENTAWLSEVNSQTLQASLEHLDNAFRKFFKKTGGFPKFKSKKDNRQSFQVPASGKVDPQKQTLSVPKIKDIPVVLHRKFEGTIKTITISKTPTDKYFASVLVEIEESEKPKQAIKESTTIGIDTGIKTFAVCSNGSEFENPKYLKSSLKRLKCLQRRVSRKQKGSNNKKKAVRRLARRHEKVANQRLNYIHQVTSKLTSSSEIQTICIEDLHVKGMLANHKLAQAISDVSLGKFYDILKYKCEWQGKHLIEIGRFEPSSKICSCCGNIKKELSLSERGYKCETCGLVIDRDRNASINIKKFGLIKNNTLSDRQGELGELRALV